jgi:pilus assembly protein Flp/PilA
LEIAVQASAGLRAGAAVEEAPINLFRDPRTGIMSADRRMPEDSMKSLAKKMQRFLVSEDGPTAVEYAVMLALIIIVCLTAINSLGTNAKTTFTNVANSIGS